MKDIICQGGERMETVIIAEAVLPVDIYRRREFCQCVYLQLDSRQCEYYGKRI